MGRGGRWEVEETSGARSQYGEDAGDNGELAPNYWVKGVTGGGLHSLGRLLTTENTGKDVAGLDCDGGVQRSSRRCTRVDYT